MKNHTKNRRAGFTLAEMMVVIVIIGLLATLVVPSVIQRLAKAFGGTAEANIISIESALNEYAINNSMKFPDSLEALVTPDENGHTYLQQRTLPKDPWGNEYQYEMPRDGDPRPRVFTLGKDQAVGGEGENADIDNFTIRGETGSR